MSIISLTSLPPTFPPLTLSPLMTSLLQVVKYGMEGHYESHWDSESENKGPCCEGTQSFVHGPKNSDSLAP